MSSFSSTERPVWLSEEREIGALLHAALDRFDRQPAEARQRNIFLPVERYIPSLARADAAADQTWSLVCELERGGVLAVRESRRGPYDPQWKGAKLVFTAGSEVILRDWLNRERMTPELQLWREAVRKHAQAFPGGCEALLARRIAIGGRSPEEIAGAFARIGAVRGPLTLRQLSALAFWGDSKVLDDRGELIAALFPQLEIRERALVVSVFLPAVCSGVLFVENQDTYTAACRGHPSAAADLVLVFASGFRGSAERIRSRDGALLHYAGAGATQWRTSFESWWFDQGEPPGPCAFWGDLDFAGMQILKSLRSRFGEVTAWQPGYEHMLAALRREGGYTTAGQQDPLSTGCPYADEALLPAIRELGQLDQERWIADSG